jgi:hypothetical protein
VTDYEQVVRDFDAIVAWNPDLVVLDEAQSRQACRAVGDYPAAIPVSSAASSPSGTASMSAASRKRSVPG